MSGDLIRLVVILGLAVGVVIGVTEWLQKGLAEIERAKQACLDEADEADHADWLDILATIGLTEDEVKVAYQRAQLAERMDRIRTDIAVNQFRRELEDYEGGAS